MHLTSSTDLRSFRKRDASLTGIYCSTASFGSLCHESNAWPVHASHSGGMKSHTNSFTHQITVHHSQRLTRIWNEFETRCRSPPTFGSIDGELIRPDVRRSQHPVYSYDESYRGVLYSANSMSNLDEYGNPVVMTPARSRNPYRRGYGAVNPASAYGSIGRGSGYGSVGAGSGYGTVGTASGYGTAPVASVYRPVAVAPAYGAATGGNFPTQRLPASAFFAPGTKMIHWEGARLALDEIIADRRHLIFGPAPQFLAPPPPDAMLMVAKVAQVGKTMLPNLCNEAAKLMFTNAVRQHLVYHMPSLRNYVERENYCTTIMAFLNGPGRPDVEKVLQNFAT